jgi:glycosyltransferase involved in cell wall biosynthesis
VRVAALVPYPPDTTPSQRFRLEQWAPLLAAEEIRLELMPFADRPLMERLYARGGTASKAAGMLGACLARLAAVPAVRRADVVVVHRAACLAGPALVERLLAGLGARIVYDFDDAIYVLHTSAANRRFGRLKVPHKTRALCRLAAHVVVANEGLAEWARPLNPELSVVPSSVDLERFRPTSQEARFGPLIIGWTGSSTSLTHLESFAPVLRAILSHLPAELHVHCDREPKLLDVPYVFYRWSAADEPEVLARFDVGIMPMPDDPWARGKSAMKALLCMAMGKPVVASPVGTNLELIAHEANGMLARTPEEWFACLERLASDPGLRERLGQAGRETVEARYSARRSASLFAGVLRRVAAGGR